MKFTIDQKVLSRSLQRIIGVVPSKTSLPILSNILLELDGSKLKLATTDLEVSIVTSLQVGGAKDGKTLLPAKKLFDIVRELPDAPVTFTITDAGKATIKTEKGEYKISGESADDFPVIPSEKTATKIKYPLATFLDMISKTQFAASTNEYQAVLRGVLLEVGNGFRLVATDGHRLVRVADTEFKNGKKNAAASVIIPTKALAVLSKNADQTEDVEIGIGEYQVTFILGATTIYSKLINEQYPDYEKVIPKDNGLTLIIDRGMLAASVSRVEQFANEVTRNIRLNLSADAVTVQAEDSETSSEANEHLPAQYEGAEIEFGCNAQYLQEILKHIDGDEILMRLNKPDTGIIIEPVQQREGEEHIVVLMPVKLNNE